MSRKELPAGNGALITTDQDNHGQETYPAWNPKQRHFLILAYQLDFRHQCGDPRLEELGVSLQKCEEPRSNITPLTSSHDRIVSRLMLII